MSLEINAGEVKRFLATLWPDQQSGFLTISTKGSNGGWTSKHFSHPLKTDIVCNAVGRLAGSDVYHTVGAIGQRPANGGRGKADDVAALPALFADIDCLEGVHSETALPSRDQALEFLESLHLKPSILIWSGGGFQAYWIFEAPIVFNGKDERNRVKALSKGWSGYLRSKALERGWKVDNVSSIEHALRLPGTFNFKSAPVPVEIVNTTDLRYTVESFQPFTVKLSNGSGSGSGSGSDSRSGSSGSGSGPAWEVVNKCSFLRHCRDDAGSLPEPHWWAMIASLCFMGNSRDTLHMLSAVHPEYTSDGTDRKILEALKQSGPMTCAKIREIDDSYCPTSGCNVACPVHLIDRTKRFAQPDFEAGSDSDSVDDVCVPEWPTLPSVALSGLAGRFVDLASRDSEADPAAILITFLSRFGAEVGPSPFMLVGDTKHFARLFAVVVGNTSKSRKGTSAGPVDRVFTRNGYIVPAGGSIDLGLFLASDKPARCSPGPISTGEGLINEVRDEVTQYQVDKKTQEGRQVVVDPGVEDKRFSIVTEEFASVLIASRREGNTVSTVLRTLWDSGNCDPITKSNRIKCTGAHVCIIGHITLEELTLKLEETEAFSGFANRFMWFLSRRNGLVPRPRPMPSKELEAFQSDMRAAIRTGQGFAEMTRDAECDELWDECYPELSADHSGLTGSVLNRAEAQTLRLSMVYALLDSSRTIEARHLESALATWQYAEQSAKFIFSGKNSNPYVSKILDLIREKEVVTTTDIHGAFSRHAKQDQIDAAVKELLTKNSIKKEVVRTAGRPKVIYTAV